jgi:hypothetical protein
MQRLHPQKDALATLSHTTGDRTSGNTMQTPRGSPERSHSLILTGDPRAAVLVRSSTLARLGRISQ